MTGTLCLLCEHNQKCRDFGISLTLASRLMIARSAQREGEHFPINIYREELKSEGLCADSTVDFIETIVPLCIYVNTH